ncbi:S8 family peptidase [Spirillospora albida]|uniref:S8 family peptidase n=1 Tax=Spirillospora albida TaxID=58123 RepID=UPI00068EB60C|nr:S8 family serine peptidase [Spirillospora albida]
MSQAGRRARPAARAGARTTAVLTVLTLGAAVAVPVAIAPGDDRLAPRQDVRGAAAGAPFAAAAASRADQIRAREWHLTAMRAQRAWKWSKGAGVTVAVLDTGVDRRHPDLTGRVVSGPDLAGGARRPGGRYWGLHGTSMASIIAGHGHGPGLSEGMMGVAPQSRILSVRVTLENDDPLRRGDQQAAGDRDPVAQGIRYAVDQGADIINMSLGGGRPAYNGSRSGESAIRYALGKGVVLIASAGNDGSSANRKNFPAAYPGVIAVGALDKRLRVWKDSNRHPYVAVCAPGVDIVSADAGGGYIVGSGTSASSAMVAGVAALVRSRYPDLDPEDVRRALVQGSPARAGRPTGSSTCAGPVDAVRTLVAAAAINRTAGAPEPAPPASASPAPIAEQEPAEDSGWLLPAVLGGGGVLVVVGLVLGWRQRRPEEEDAPDALPDEPREPVAASVAAAQAGPPPEFAGTPEPVPVEEPPPGPAPRPAPELRPFVPGEFAPDGGARAPAPLNGNGHAPANGGVPANGDAHTSRPGDPSPAGDTGPLDDEDWERFRRSALADPGEPAVTDEPAAPPPAKPDDDEEYRPPWW